MGAPYMASFQDDPDDGFVDNWIADWWWQRMAAVRGECVLFSGFGFAGAPLCETNPEKEKMYGWGVATQGSDARQRSVVTLG